MLITPLQNKTEGLKKKVVIIGKLIKAQKIHVKSFLRKVSFCTAILGNWSLPRGTNYIHIFTVFKDKTNTC